MYQSITSAMSGGALGWVKCSANDSSVEQCTGMTPVPPSSGGAPAHLLRRSFTAPSTVAAAFLYVAAVGWAEPYVNGNLLAPSEVLNPGRTSFDMREYYLCYNVTGLLTAGTRNVIGIQAAAGWQSMPGHQLSVRSFLSIVDEKKTKTTITTSTDWEGFIGGGVVSANIYGGEAYDARLEIAGWSAPSFNPDGWGAAVAVTEFAAVTPSWQPMQPIRLLERNPPESVSPIMLKSTEETVFVYKFPQNAAAVSALTLQDCPAGTVLTVYPSENLCGVGPTRWSPPCPSDQSPGGGQPGTVDQRNLRGMQSSQYTCKGVAEESWTPRFTYTG